MQSERKVAVVTGASQGIGAELVRSFVDRGYRSDGTLRLRHESEAVIHDPEQVVAHVLTLVRDREPDTICLHGDTPGAAVLAARVRAALNEAGFDVRSVGL